MKSYPSIQREYIKDIPMFAFLKYDGNLVRCEWSAKRCFYKFGTKNALIDKNSPIFGESIDVFLNKYEKNIVPIFEKMRWRNVVCFCEFYGENSFAGNHKQEQHDMMLFDVSVNDSLLTPKEFIDTFESIDIAKLLYRGNVGEEFIKSVHDSTLEGIGSEGVVCKGGWNKKQNLPYMFKIKTNAWIEKLKTYCNGNMDLMGRLL